MYEFLDRLVASRCRVSATSAAFRRTRSTAVAITRSVFGSRLIFPEIDYDKIDKTRGLEMSIVTTAKNDEEGRRLLALLGMPFAKHRAAGCS